VSTLFCVGQNYADHAREMGAEPAPTEPPVVFLKPEGARLAPPGPIRLPPGAGEVHHEAEVVVRVGAGGVPDGVALGLDLTDRTRQARAKARGLPWAEAKGFRGAAPLGPFVPVLDPSRLEHLRFTLEVNGVVRQRGDTSRWIHPLPRLLAHLDAWFGLTAGDLVFTGTPAGVGPVCSGDVLRLDLDGEPAARARFVVA